MKIYLQKNVWDVFKYYLKIIFAKQFSSIDCSEIVTFGLFINGVTKAEHSFICFTGFHKIYPNMPDDNSELKIYSIPMMTVMF